MAFGGRGEGRAIRASDAVLTTFERTPTPPELAHLDPAELAPLAQADPFGCATYLVGEFPKISAKQLASELERLGAPRLTKREASRWREMALAGEAPRYRVPVDSDPADEHVDAPTARERLATAIKMGDANGALRWGRVVQTLHDTATPDGEQVDPLDFSRLSDAQLSAYKALTDIARGADLDDEGMWWRTLFGRVPSARAEVHPAHVALPAGSPEPAVLTPTR